MTEGTDPRDGRKAPPAPPDDYAYGTPAPARHRGTPEREPVPVYLVDLNAERVRRSPVLRTIAIIGHVSSLVAWTCVALLLAFLIVAFVVGVVT